MKRKYIIASVLLLVGFIIGYTVSSKQWNTYSWASSQNGMLIPLFEYYRPSAVGNEEEKMNQTYHLALGVLFGNRYLSDREALDEANTHTLIEKILESRLARGLPIIEESLLPNATRTTVLENFYGYLDHIEFNIEPDAVVNASAAVGKAENHLHD